MELLIYGLYTTNKLNKIIVIYEVIMNQTSPVALPPTKLVVEGLRPSDQFPLEIVHRILQYDGRIKYRNGKYMNQIASDDDRYKMLLTVPKIETCYNHYLCMTITGNGNKIYCEKYETLWYHYGENPIINIYTSSKICQYMFKKEDICYKYTILRKPKPKPKPTLWSDIIKYLYDLCRKFI